MKTLTILMAIFIFSLLLLSLIVLRNSNRDGIIKGTNNPLVKVEESQLVKGFNQLAFKDELNRFTFNYPRKWKVLKNRYEGVYDYDWFQGIGSKEAESIVKKYGVSYFSLENPNVTMDSSNLPLEVFVINSDWESFFEIYQGEGMSYLDPNVALNNLKISINANGSEYSELRVRYDLGDNMRAEYYIFKLKDDANLILKMKRPAKSDNVNQADFLNILNSVKVKS
jgi:hypothetical protein